MFRHLLSSLRPLTLLAAFLLLFLLTPRAHADGLIVIHNPPHAVPGHFSFAPLEVVYHKVDATIDDQLAVTSVDQEFYNPNAARLEGDYIFPVPPNAQINKFTMDIDGKQVEAELLPADKARAVYEEIVRKAKDPALLEYAGRAMFRVRIFPIEPNAKKRITLKYTQLLKADNAGGGNLLDYHYTLNTEKYSAKPLKNLSLKLTINSSLPLTTIYSPTHEVEIRRPADAGGTKAVVGYEAKDVRPDTDFHLYIGRKASPVGLSVLTYKPDPDKEGYFVLLAAPTLSKDAKPMPKDVVFVMDTSGSMSGAKIEQTKKALKFCVDTLNPDDWFDIVRFSTETEPFFGKLTRASDENRKKAAEFALNLKATGGTAIDEAIGKALAEVIIDMADGRVAANRLRMIVFLTDGQPTVGEQNPDTILAHAKKAAKDTPVRIFSFGVGTDVNTKLLDLVAEQTRGYSQYVLPNEDIEVAVSNFFAKVQDPILAGLKLDTGSAAAGKLYPKDLPDLFNGEQLIVFGTYAKPGPTAFTLTGTANGQAEKFAQDISFPDKTDPANEWIAKLWAVRRVGYLLDEIRLHGENKELKDEVTDLARKFGIVTPYTAMLIIEDEKARGVATNTRVLQDMERDRSAMAFAKAGSDSFRPGEGRESGSMAVKGSINANDYRQNKSLDGFAKVAEQKAERNQFEGQRGAALARSASATPAPASSPAGPGSWISHAAESESSAAPVAGYRVVTNYAQQNRVINNRAFYLNGNQWIDGRVQNANAKAQRRQIKFNSDEYFQLLKDHADAAQWLALGNNVTFELAGTIYEITETEAPPATP